jgi:hypothetical protein
MNKRIFVMIDNDPSSVGDGWAATPAEVVEAFVDFVEANMVEMYPDHDVTVVSGPRTSVEADTPARTADIESSVRWFWTVFIENDHEGLV